MRGETNPSTASQQTRKRWAKGVVVDLLKTKPPVVGSKRDSCNVDVVGCLHVSDFSARPHVLAYREVQGLQGSSTKTGGEEETIPDGVQTYI